MKCPKCGTKTKPQAGARCSCGYGFGLNPRESPYISDLTMSRIIDKLSNFGRHFFTFNQLFAAVYRALVKKKHKKRVLGTALLAVIALVVAGIVYLNKSLFAALVVLVLAGIGLVLLSRRPTQIAHEDVKKAIKAYETVNPIPNMVDGRRFKRETSKQKIKHELFDYAPERILIVPTDDMVDMLVLNRFHMDHKTAIVSATKYPHHVFEACQRMLEKHPDIPVEVIHDVSHEGSKLRAKLIADPTWNLEGKHVKDLGLFPEDVKRIQTPVWIPSGRPSSMLSAKGPATEAEKKMQEGMRMPVDFVGPGIMMGALGLAAVGGLLLMNDQLLAEEIRKKSNEGGDGGYG